MIQAISDLAFEKYQKPGGPEGFPAYLFFVDICQSLIYYISYSECFNTVETVKSYIKQI